MTKREGIFLAAAILILSAILGWHVWRTDKQYNVLHSRQDFLLYVHNVHLMHEHGVQPEVKPDVPNSPSNNLLRATNR